MKKSFISISIFIILLICLSSAAVFGGTKKDTHKKYYETVTVNKGETIWSVASKFNDKNLDLSEYVQEIMDFNGIKTSFILAGEKIVVPIYY